MGFTSADLLRIIVGLIALTVGAEFLVRGAGRLARRLRIPALVVGLTVVAMGTSAPEIAVSVDAAMAGQSDIALGNVVGSNIFNVLFILGLAALAAPLVVQSQLVRLDVPVMVVVSALPLLLGLDRLISLGDGAFLLGLLVAYVTILGWMARKGRVDASRLEVEAGVLPQRLWWLDVALAAAGLGLLVGGAEWLVHGASAVARAAGISELVIGLTLVAAGTSLPELATSVVASLRGERDLAVGNIVGSNIFNVLAVLGVGAVAGGGLPVPEGMLHFDLPVMLTVAIVCVPVFMTRATISRLEGAVFLFYYLLYAIYLGLHTTDHALQEEFGIAVVAVILPLTLAIAFWLQHRTSAPLGFIDGRQQESPDHEEHQNGRHADPL